MRSIIPTAAARSRSVMVAVVLGTALTAGDTKAHDSLAALRALPPDVRPDVVQDITRYCQACWRNARLPEDHWPDCTQQVFARLLERVPVSQWSFFLTDDESAERKEFFRAIDAVKKRTQRSRRYSDLPSDFADVRNRANDYLREQREAVTLASQAVLSERQRKIVEMTAHGWAVPEIAAELNTTPERVSDEKYKAIRKLRDHLGVDAVG